MLAILAVTLPLRAADSVTVDWEQICRKASDHEVVIKTTAGENVDGYCIGIDVNEVSVNVKGKRVKVARDQVVKLLVLRRPSQLKALGHGVRDGLHYGFNALFSPAMPIGVVAIPGSIVWGVVATPFCALGDLKAKLSHNTEIKIK